MSHCELLKEVLGGHRLSETEGVSLMSARGREIFPIISAADELRQEKAGETVTYVRNQNIHVTNICKNLCGFCGFGKRGSDPGAYCDDRTTVEEKGRLAKSRSVTEICLLSGVHPDFSVESYVDILRWVRQAAPDVHIHAFSPEEVTYAASKSGISSIETLVQFKNAGLGSLQGTAAEILVDEIRAVICPNKIDTATWVRVIKEAHSLGIPTTATIMYGHCETPGDKIRHLAILREIQAETEGFTELVPLSFVHNETPLSRSGLTRPGATGREDLLFTAVSRLFLDNFRNIQVSWGKVGLKMTEICLLSGANDLAGTMYNDDVSDSAGAKDAGYLSPATMERISADIGRPLRQRTTLYELV